ncbi:MAG: universal stress protein [Dehalococcoidia bacterium]
MYRKLLLTLDGSEVSAKAVPHAVQIATSSGAEVVLLRVVDSVGHIIAQSTPAGFEMSAGGVTADIAEQAVAAQQQAAQAELDDVAEQLRAQGVQTVSTVVAEGIPGDEIVRAADELGCDIVVMATHGRSGLGRAVLGSVADHVVRHTPKSAVLLVRVHD